MKQVLAALGMVAFLSGCGTLSAADTAPAPVSSPQSDEKIRVSKIILVGDSTTAVKSGWGGAFCSDHVTSKTACVNLARGGRSTLSFRREGSWDNTLAEMGAPGYEAIYVLIQFGHNDQPGKPGRSTDLETGYIPNLKRYVEETRAAGAIPVLVTPLTRRFFSDGVVSQSLTPWADAVRNIAKEMDVAVVDLHRRSQEIVAQMGPQAAMDLSQAPPTKGVRDAAASGTTIPSTKTRIGGEALPAPYESFARHGRYFDYTHLGRDGADVFANEVALMLGLAVPDLAPSLYATAPGQ